MLPGFLTTQQAAKQLRRTDRRIRQMVADGEITGAVAIGEKAIHLIPLTEVIRLKPILRKRYRKTRKHTTPPLPTEDGSPVATS